MSEIVDDKKAALVLTWVIALPDTPLGVLSLAKQAMGIDQKLSKIEMLRFNQLKKRINDLTKTIAMMRDQGYNVEPLEKMRADAETEIESIRETEVLNLDSHRRIRDASK